MDTLTTNYDTAAFLRLLHAPGHVFEIRVPKCPYRVGVPGRYTTSGYYTDVTAAVRDVATLETLKPAGIYVSVNPCKPELLARSVNCLTQNATCTTADPDVARLAWLFVDIDPARPSGVSSTDEEMAAAITLARHIRDDLAGGGWPDAVLFMSGNGAGMLFRIDLDNTPEDASLVARVLQGLSQRYSTAAAHVDTTTGNPARIMKVIGTTARKGSHLVGVEGIADRPHRKSWFEPPTVPLCIVPRDLLEAVAITPTATTTTNTVSSDFSVEDFIQRHHLDVSEPRDWPGNKKRWTLRQSPMCEHHDDGPYIGILNSGAITAGCHHDSCSWDWHALREKYEPKPDISAVIAKGETVQPETSAPKAKLHTLQAAAEAYLEAIGNGDPLIDLGIPELSYALGGGVELGEMVIVAARPSHGKSAVMLQTMHECAANGLEGLIVSEEMSSLALGKRAIQFISPVHQNNWLNQRDTVAKQIDHHFHDRKPIHIVESCRTPTNVEKAVERYVKEHGVQVVAVDYAQMLLGIGKSRYEQVSNTSTRLRQMANQHNILLIVLAQLNREIEGRNSFVPKMTDLRDAGQLEQDADCIVFLVWPHRIDSKNDPAEFQIFVAKNRNRPINCPAFTCRFEPGRQRLSDMRPANYEPAFDQTDDEGLAI
jgi:archaellum biogenesis ATPase FlaH